MQDPFLLRFLCSEPLHRAVFYRSPQAFVPRAESPLMDRPSHGNMFLLRQLQRLTPVSLTDGTLPDTFPCCASCSPCYSCLRFIPGKGTGWDSWGCPVQGQQLHLILVGSFQLGIFPDSELTNQTAQPLLSHLLAALSAGAAFLTWQLNPVAEAGEVPAGHKAEPPPLLPVSPVSPSSSLQ